MAFKHQVKQTRKPRDTFREAQQMSMAQILFTFDVGSSITNVCYNIHNGVLALYILESHRISRGKNVDYSDGNATVYVEEWVRTVRLNKNEAYNSQIITRALGSLGVQLLSTKGVLCAKGLLRYQFYITLQIIT